MKIKKTIAYFKNPIADFKSGPKTTPDSVHFQMIIKVQMLHAFGIKNKYFYKPFIK